MSIFKRLISDSGVEKRYLRAGAEFGDAVSYLYMGECLDFRIRLLVWEDWEEEYAKRGYRTMPLDDFVEFGGYGKSIDHLLGKEREDEEEPIFYAKIFQEVFPDGIPPIINLDSVEKTASGNLYSSSTKPYE